tara:strand:- start:204 stop:449 length:246 start_codon:yes stop_codon:yes gene_type:complete
MKKEIVVKNLDKIFTKIFKVKKSQLHKLSIASFYKWDSIAHIQLIIEIEKKIGVTINYNSRINLISYNKIKKYLINQLVRK